MYPTLQRIANAEAAGWTNVRESAVKRGSRKCQLVGNSPDGKHGIVPNFMKSNKMTEQEQRIAIGKLCGWWVMWDDEYGPLRGRKDQTSSVYLVPDYLNDLNAMHEAEKVLSYVQMLVFCTNLTGILMRSGEACRFDIVHSSASQRAEALLMTLWLWDENTKAHPRTNKQT